MPRKKWGRIGSPKSAKRKKFLKSIRPKSNPKKRKGTKKRKRGKR